MKKIEHIGIAVKNLEASNQLFTQLLGIPPYKTENVPSEGVKTAFFQLDNIKIELLEATQENSPIAKFIKKRGEGLHHLAFEVDDIVKNTEKQAFNGFIPIQPRPREGADNKKVNFLHPKTTNSVLVELCQENI